MDLICIYIRSSKNGFKQWQGVFELEELSWKLLIKVQHAGSISGALMLNLKTDVKAKHAQPIRA